MENKHGEFWLEFSSGSLLCVTKYEGFDDKHYVCLHCGSFSLYHKGGASVEKVACSLLVRRIYILLNKENVLRTEIDIRNYFPWGVLFHWQSNNYCKLKVGFYVLFFAMTLLRYNSYSM